MLLDQVGSFLDQRCDDLQIPPLDYRESFEQVRDKLLYEVRLDKEQNNLSLARGFHKEIPGSDSGLFDFAHPGSPLWNRCSGKK